ncbi:PLP-dependent aminotransferase family protein [Streptococcus sp. FDAARGOS_146]|uniref:aminotransferase-like domain-containing protein n=1 Tax=Streptococcus sp. FDAARGOS_146 TaxID=1702171 RepID=UPI00073549DC|nr:PLP-dependent aminotransferase family protein [Streptococcus sp. FDAARGOS_146]PNM83144.1 PLP-dependent aminotransferase family protein [Streptococcus sp. FDAARGOS_146]
MPKSKYQCIVDRIRQDIQNGKLLKGQKIPSIRKLADKYHCSKDTVQKALMELKYQKYIYAVPRSGYYVLENSLEDQQYMELSVRDDRHQIYEDFRICLNETLIGRENYLFNYYSQQEGLEDLRQSVQQLLLDSVVYTSADKLVLTSGTQQALYILSQIVFPNEKHEILVEQPTYHRINDLLTAQKLPYQTIERTPEGIDLEELEWIFRTGHIKFFYTIPRFHYPLEHSYNRKEKEEIIRLAQLYDVYIVEDDYLADFDSKHELTFHYLDDSQHVIYIKSFSASLFPALRITALLLPSDIQSAFIAYKKAVDYDSNLIMQKALSLYIDNLMFEKNRLFLLNKQEKEVMRAKKLLSENQLKLSYFLNRDGILLDLRGLKSVSSFKHSNLPLDFFESSYIHDCPYQYAKIRYENLEKTLQHLNKYL